MHHFIHVIHYLWEEVGIPVWPNLLASFLVWMFLRFQTITIRELHEHKEEEAQRRHEEMLNAVASSSSTTVINNPEEVIVNKEE